MRKNVLAKDLKVGDTVKMSHVSDGAYTAMTVVEIDVNCNGVTCLRPYLVPSADSYTKCPISNKRALRHHVGLEPVWFPLDGSMRFDLLSESYVTQTK